MENVERNARLVAYCITYGNSEQARRRYYEEYGEEAPDGRTIRRWTDKFLSTGSILPRSSSGNRTSRVLNEKKDSIVNAITDNPRTSQRVIANEVGVSHRTVGRTLKENGYKPYKVHQMHQIFSHDEQSRLAFCRSILERNSEESSWSDRIIFSDECTFHMSGRVNHHNDFFYATSNPHVYDEVSIRSKGLTVFVAVSYHGIIAVDISEDTMTSDRYCDILSKKVFPVLSQSLHRSAVFQQDGAPPHFSNKTRNLLNRHLNNRWIGRGGPIPWPARSPDLTICDFFLWGHIQNKVYAFSFENNEQLKLKIEEELKEIPLSFIRNSFKNFVHRCEVCVAQSGGHFEHLL